MTEPTTPPTTPTDSAETNEGASQPSQDAAEHSTPDETEPTIELEIDTDLRATGSELIGALDDDDFETEPSTNDARPGDVEQAFDSSELLGIRTPPERGQRRKFRGVDVEITGVHDDGDFDCHVLNPDGSLKLAADGLTPLWYERQSPTELED